MGKIVILMGLPASGKSTWAKQLVKDNPGQYKRINKDDLRAMIDCSIHSEKNEKFVLSVRDFVVEESLRRGINVIVDDTNLHPEHIQRLTELAKKHNAEVEVNDSFLSVSVEECIVRDSKRGEASVGEEVIRRMFNQFVKSGQKPSKETVKQYNELKVVKDYLHQDLSLPQCIICDIDGTIAEKGNRSPYDWDKVDLDTPKRNVIELVERYSKDHRVIFMSGRDEACREKTEKWIRDNVSVADFELHMRPKGNSEKDSIIKKRLYEEHVLGKWFVKFVLDDRVQVVRLWRHELDVSLTCLQVDDGDF